MNCDNCGKENPMVLVGAQRQRDNGVGRAQNWCLECIKGRNPIKDYPT